MNLFGEMASNLIESHGAPLALAFGLALLFKAWEVFTHSRSKSRIEGAILAMIIGIPVTAYAFKALLKMGLAFLKTNLPIIASGIGFILIGTGIWGLIIWKKKVYPTTNNKG